MSNTYISKFEVGDDTYETIEQYYFSMMVSPNKTLKEKIIKSPSKEVPLVIKRMEHFKHSIRKNWDSIKDEIMFKGLLAKFMQNSSLKLNLLKTGNKPIVFINRYQKHWSNGLDGSGENTLGKLLMRVRAYISKSVTQEEQSKILEWEENVRKNNHMLSIKDHIDFNGNKYSCPEFSNDYPTKIVIDGKTFESVQHYYN